MIIKSITLENFRNFKHCDISFSNDSDKNFTVILGENTYGKTTLVKSFIWCFYGTNSFNNPILLNKDVENGLNTNGEAECNVVVWFEHNDDEYKIKRRILYKKASDLSLNPVLNALTLTKYINDKAESPLSGDEAQSEIDAILDSDLKDYFFFDGENNTIEKVASRKNIKDAVSNLLGYGKWETYCKYLKSSGGVIPTLQSELKSDGIEIDDILNNLNETKDSAEKLEQTNEELNKDIENLEIEEKDLENKLNSYKEIGELQDKKISLEKEIKELKNDKKTKMDSLYRTINFEYGTILSNLFLTYSFNLHNFNKINEDTTFNRENAYVDISEGAIDDLLKKGKCLCGCDINTNLEARKHLIEAKKHMKPQDFSSHINNFIDGEKSSMISNDASVNSLRNLCNQIIDTIQKIDLKEKDLNKIKDKIIGTPDVGSFQVRLREISGLIASKNVSIKYNNEKIEASNKKISQYEIQLQQVTTKNERNRFINECISYAEKLYSMYNNRLMNEKREMKRDLQLNVDEIFSDIYGKNKRRITIDDEYRVDTVIKNDENDSTLDKSTGLQTMINYSFVAGLLNTCKEEFKKRNDEESDNDTKFPLVMDAPFSSIDEEHLKKICTVLPQKCDQLIMFVMEKDFNIAKESLTGKIGKIYRLKKNSETESTVDEETL